MLGGNGLDSSYESRYIKLQVDEGLKKGMSCDERL